MKRKIETGAVLERKRLSRRTFLRGCGVAVALPLLEIMEPSTLEARPESENSRAPRRAAFFYIPNGVVQSAWHPKNDGEGLELSPTLAPLAKVRRKVTLFTKLDRVKVAGTDGHAQAGACWLSSAAPDELSPAGYPLKRTLDQIMAATAGEHTAFRSLELSCNPYEDNRESVYFDNISWYGHGHVARSMRDPKEVFQRLFATTEHAEHSSVLDLVLDDARALRRELGRIDRHKLGEYLDSVRTVEKQIERVGARQAELSRLDLRAPAQPWQVLRRDEFIQIMGDLMVLALQTDLTRVSTIMSSPERWGSPLMVHGLFDKPIDHHGMTHAQGNPRVREDLAALDRFHVEQFARLVEKMDAIEEGETSLLDNTMFLLGSGISAGNLHVYTDLPTVIAGGGAGAIRTNRHVRSKDGTPIANLFLSLAQAMGAKVDRFADSSGPLALS